MIHPTKIVVVGIRNGIEFKALVPWEKFDELIAKCNAEYCPNSPLPAAEKR